MSDIQSAVNSFKLSFFKNNKTQNNNKVTEKLFAKYKLKSEDEQQKESQVDTSTIGLTLKDAVDSIFDPTTGMSDEEKKKFIDKLYKKIKSGKKLSADEMQYLRMNDPVTYAKMAKVQIQRKALESRLKQAKSKEEALEIYTSAKSRISDDDPAREELNAAYDDAYGEFKKSDILVCNFLNSRNLYSLSVFYNLNKFCCLRKSIHSSCVKPCIASSESYNIKFAFFKINLIQIRYLKFTSCRRLNLFCIFNNIFVIKIKSSNTVV